MNSDNDSKAKKVLRLIQTNPQETFDLKKICQEYASSYNEPIKSLRATTILARLYRKGMFLRTKTQLSHGYCYSISNVEKLSKL